MVRLRWLPFLVLFAPFVIPWVLTIAASNGCAKRGGTWRFLGVLVSLALGVACIVCGYALGFQGGEPNPMLFTVAGVIGIIVGVVCIVVGITTSAMATREHIELQEMAERLQKEREPSAYCMKCGESLTEPGGLCRKCGSKATIEKGSEDEYCRICGCELMGPGGPCRKCDDVKTRPCPSCGLYTPVNRRACVYCGANAN